MYIYNYIHSSNGYNFNNGTIEGANHNRPIKATNYNHKDDKR